MSGLPPSLAVTPNIAWEHQTIDQLEAEHAYWVEQVRTASGFSSANAADGFRQACETWLAKRRTDA